MYINKKKEKGFTLVEFTIVLIIIGLIVSGVLVDQELINSAKLRSTIQQLEGYQTAVNTFNLKFDSLPGDALATDIPNTTLRGNNNGIIEDADGGVQNLIKNEILKFWHHLSHNGLIAGNFNGINDTSRPAGKLTGTSENVYSQSRIHFFHLGLPGSSITGAAITPSYAKSLDGKLDNGLPLTGNVTAAYRMDSPTTLIVGHTNYSITSKKGACTTEVSINTVYNIDFGDTKACQLRFVMQ